MSSVKIIFFILITISLFNACKKDDSKQIECDSVAALKLFKEEVANKGATTIYPIHKTLEKVIYGDKFGNERTIYLNQSGSTNSFGPCDGLYNCTNTPDPDDPGTLESPDINLTYGTRVKYCGNAANNSDVTVQYEMSVPYNILSANPNNSNQLSRGKIKFINTQNQTVASYTNITPVTITNLGNDPDCSNRTIFRYEFSLTNLSNGLFEDGNKMQSNFLYYTDCGIVNNVTGGYEDAIEYTYSGSVGAPCTRTDIIYISIPYTSGAYSQALGVGNTIGCSFPYGWVYPDAQQMEYWKTSSPGTVYTFSFGPFGYYNLTQVTYGSGSWVFRYRNQMTSPACSGPWLYQYYTF